MDRAEQLAKVKASMMITDTSLDDAIGIKMDDVKLFMEDAGVSKSVIDSDKSIGCICKGTADAYYDGEYSADFYKRVSQLTLSEVE